jgi:hypothetical protein
LNNDPKFSRTLAATAVALSAALAACAEDPAARVTGTIGVALVTTGSDGATYRLTAGARLSLFRAEPQFFLFVPLDGDGDVVTFPAPPGTYDAELLHDEHTTHWPLERIVDGVATAVTARLVTPQPAAVTVASGATTTLLLQFTIADGTVVHFDRGTVAVEVEVVTAPATGHRAELHAWATVSSASFAGPHAGELEARLPSAGAELGVGVRGRVIGAFVDSGGISDGSTSVCAAFAVDVRFFGGHAGFGDLFSEVGWGSAPGYLFGPASLCVADVATGDRLRIRLSRVGAPISPTLSELTGEDLAMTLILTARLPQEVYDYQTGRLDLAALSQTLSELPFAGLVYVTRAADPVDAAAWLSLSLSGHAAVVFSGET